MLERSKESNAMRSWPATSARRLMHLVGLGVALYVLVSIFPWPYGERHIEWTETIALASGETTVIERVQRVEIHLTSEGASGDLGKMAIVASATSPPAFPTWQAKMFPILLDRHPDTGAWLLVATMSNCSFWRRNGTPTPPYWAFQVEDGKWKRVVVPEFLWGRPANLFAAFESTDNSSSVRATYAARRAAQLRQGVALDVAGVWRESSTTCTGLPSGYENAIELDLWQFGRERCRRQRPERFG